MSSRKTPYAGFFVLSAAIVASLVYFSDARANAKLPAAKAMAFEMFFACWHDEASEYHCGGDTSGFTDATRSPEGGRPTVRFASYTKRSEASRRLNLIPSDQIDSLVLTAYVKDGSTRRKTFPNTADAIFLSRTSTENMLRAYYLGRWRNVRFTAATREGARIKAVALRDSIAKIWNRPARRTP